MSSIKCYAAAAGAAVIFLLLPEVGLTKVEILLSLGFLYGLILYIWWGIEQVVIKKRERKFRRMIRLTTMR